MISTILPLSPCYRDETETNLLCKLNHQIRSVQDRPDSPQAFLHCGKSLSVLRKLQFAPFMVLAAGAVVIISELMFIGTWHHTSSVTLNLYRVIFQLWFCHKCSTVQEI